MDDLFARADQLIHDGRAGQAALLLRDHLQSNPPCRQSLALLGLAELESGNPPMAVAALQAALEMDPSQALTNYHLGLALGAAGRLAEARPFFARAVALAPNLDGARFQHGLALLAAGRPAEAEEHLQRAVGLQPGRAEYVYHLGLAERALSRDGEAEQAFARALALSPKHRGACLGLAEILRERGELDRAADALAACLQGQPKWNQGRKNLAWLLARAGRLPQAIEQWREVCRARPGDFEAWMALGGALYQARRHAEAQQAYEQALALEPANGPALLALGECHNILGRPEQGAAFWQRAAEADPSLVQAWFFLGNYHRNRNRLAEAAACFQKVAELDPQSGEAFNNLGHVEMAAGRVGPAQAAYARALKLLPGDPAVAQNHLLTLHYDPAASLAAIKQAALDWAGRFAPRPLPPARRPPLAGRPLRVGYLSGDLRQHPVGIFLQGVIAAHRPERVLAFCYDNFHRPGGEMDPVARAIRKSAAGWREIRGLDDRRAAALVEEDGIDLLIDLSGHTTKNRLGIMALKPAPVTATWLGYVGTIGLANLDYIVCDQWVLPRAEEPFYLEKPARLPHCYLHFTPPGFDLPTGPMPAQQNGWVTFGSFNRLAKTGRQVLASWARIMAAAPNTRLFLSTPRLADSAMQQGVRGVFSRAGVDPARLRFAAGGPRREFLAAYRQVDLCLDPFPYGGGVTSLEAIWMGAPVLTLAGDRWVAHASESILQTLGLSGLVAGSLADYEQRAVALGNDPRALAEIRRGLRERLLDSPICRTQEFTANLEALFHRMRARL